jgi:hypothetical protein
MEIPIKLCLTCSKPIKGRTDKKYCDDYCRNSYNNLMHSNCNSYTRHINCLLQKNRRILASILPETSSHTKTSYQELLERGFLFKYCTHQVLNKKGNAYHYCYDYGYWAISELTYMVVRIKNKQSST